MAAKKKNTETNAKQQDLTRLNSAALVWRIIAAILSGILLSCAFPPLNWNILAWIALLPILIIPMPKRIWERFLVGFIFGYAHFATCLHWLNEVGFGAGWMLAIWCALFPMVWYVLNSWIYWHFKDEGTKTFPGAGPLFIATEWQLVATTLLSAVLWVTLEYLRGMLFTGFPWDYLGISQYQRLPVVSLAEYTGVFGISFIIMICNLVIAAELSRQIRFFIVPLKRSTPWHFALLTLVLIPICITGRRPQVLAPADVQTIRTLAIQGNIPQCREYSEEQFQEALDVYTGMTKRGVESFPDTDLVVWPESAVPATLEYPPYSNALRELQKTTGVPLLFGTLRLHQNPENQDDWNAFNSAILLDKQASAVNYYDKMHCVPFGEYTPFGDILPWLRDIIGMGRDLTPGKSPRLFQLPKGGKAGINICYEDAFPQISRQFTRNGANLLMTITNDSWYNRSSGAEQHLSHVVFRAVENRRIILRSSNNSHTCMITPNGEILGMIEDRTDVESPFLRESQAYDIPVYDDWGDTFYTKHGDVFALICTTATVVSLLVLLGYTLADKKRKADAIKNV